MIRNIYILLLLSLSFGTVTDIDGNVYETVQIGEQLWIQENLKVTHYNDGSEIPTGLDNSSWRDITEGAFAVFNDNPSNVDVYGNLYNWYAVDDNRGLCMEGWHAPTDEEWMELEMSLGMSEEEANNWDWHGLDEGGKLKTTGTEYWYNPNIGATNESEFNALPGGNRNSSNGSYMSGGGGTGPETGDMAYFWTANSPIDIEYCDVEYCVDWVIRRCIKHDRSDILRNAHNKGMGYSIRCLADEITTGCTDPNATNYDETATVDDGSCEFTSCDGTLLVPSQYSTIQSAIDAAVDGDSVLVSAGTYVENIIWPATNGIKLIGSGEDDCIIDGSNQQASVIRFEEALGGIIDTNTLITGFTIQNGYAIGDSSYYAWESQINYGGGIYLNSSNPRLSNIIFSNNIANSDGGGMHLSNSNPILTNITFIDNSAYMSGGGMRLYDSSNPMLINVTFIGNFVIGGGAGGGICIYSSNPTLIDVSFYENYAGSGGGMSQTASSNSTLTNVIFYENYAISGGGMASYNSFASLTDVIFTENTSSNEGGGMKLLWSDVNLYNVIFNNNTTNSLGGGMMFNESDANLYNVIFSNNTAGDWGGGMVIFPDCDVNLYNVIFNNNIANINGGAIALNYGQIDIMNSILWNNLPQEIYSYYNSINISYSLIDSSLIQMDNGILNWLEGNIDADPLFCDAENGDFTVQSDSPVLGAGQDGTDMGAYGVGCEPDDVCSACNIYYTDGYPGFCCDMAWDEGGLTCLYVEAEWGLDCGGCNCFGDLAFCEEQGLMMCSDYSCAESLSQCPPECDLGDVNCDGYLDVLDVVITINIVLVDGYDEIGDMNGDGQLDILDIVILINLILNGEGVIMDIDGNVYLTVQIGEQLWMAENLKVTHYNNGDEIPTGYSNSEWGLLDMGAYAVYDDAPSNLDTYGNLYNWFVVDDDRGVCPEGWHVPSDGEYTVLTDYLGGEDIAGGKMKETGLGHWSSPNTGATNESGFTGLPAGYRNYYNGSYGSMGDYGYFWSSSEYGSSSVWLRALGYHSSGVGRVDYGKPGGFSIRCLGD